ncbi:hypothetical protein KIPB_007147, partial [Kipferlia bialata]|eukprot:g7147.t1
MDVEKFLADVFTDVEPPPMSAPLDLFHFLYSYPGIDSLQSWFRDCTSDAGSMNEFLFMASIR